MLHRVSAGKIPRMRRSSLRSPTVEEPSFDAAYFRRFYFDRGTRVTTPAEMRHRATLVAALMRHCRIPVSSILDAGCGIGSFRAPFARAWPRASYTGLEGSAYLCARYGWTQGSVVDFAPRCRYDLVVCYDVLQYLDDRLAARALANLARLTHAVLYLSALTREDWRDNCDKSMTDGDVHLRTADWYRRRLSRLFRHLGCGVWVLKSVYAPLWELERGFDPVTRARAPSRRAPDARARPRRSRPVDR